MQAPLDDHLWGFLQPLSSNPKLLRIDFWRLTPECTLGRDPAKSNLILPGIHISGHHATITWNRRNGHTSQVSIKDFSSGGTWVSGQLVGDRAYKLEDGDEIGFGAPVAVNDEDGLYDFRYIFHHVAERPMFRVDDIYVRDIELGKGTYGEVFRAYTKATNIPVAIKKMKYSTGRSFADNGVIKQHLAEIKALQSVMHPHVIQIFSVHHGASTPSIYLALEFMAGGNLLTYMQNAATPPRTGIGLPENVCREIMFQLCHAMAHCHALGITHRDLKPENILLRDVEDNGRPYIKVADFGLANIAKNLDSPELMTTMCGSYAYGAPEVFDPKAPGYDHYADSFSAGVILFAMFLLASPWVVERVSPGLPLPNMHWDSLLLRNLSGQALDLLDHLVRPDPKERVSMTGALTHGWMKAHTPLHPHIRYPRIPSKKLNRREVTR